MTPIRRGLRRLNLLGLIAAGQFHLFLGNRCYKPLSNLEVYRARPNKESSMTQKDNN